jgi:hypothetical protein
VELKPYVHFMEIATMHRKITILFAILFCALTAGLYAQKTKWRGPIFRQVDHIQIESDDPEALFNFFNKTLHLPIAWPIANQQGSVSGGVGAGNTTLEIFQYKSTSKAKRRQPKARFSGITFEPHPMADALTEMKARGIPFSVPEYQYATLPNGSRGVSLTITELRSVSNAGFSVFLYKYSKDFLSVDVSRKQLGNRLALNKGGALGLQSIREITIAVSNLDQKEKEWKQLMGEPAADNLWRVGNGPAIHLIRGGAEHQIQGIAMEVKSLSAINKDLLSPDGSFLNPLKVQNLSIRLVSSDKK